MTYSVFCYSDAGSELAVKLCGLLGLGLERVHSTAKFADRYGFTAHESISKDMEGLFRGSDALVFIGAAGIAVRTIAPHIVSKVSDPAVIVMDDRGKFVISMLSGHIGGANDIARGIADLIGAEAVVTTATDGAGRFSCDAWASKHGCVISSMKTAKEVSAAILTGDIPVSSEFDLPQQLPAGLVKSAEGKLGIYIGIRREEPYESTLRLVPKIVTLGIGCRRGMTSEEIMNAVKTVLGEDGIDIRSVGRISSIDIKKDEKGLLEAAERLGADTEFHTAEELNAVPGDFEESEFVRKTVGTGNVCERAAAFSGGKIIIKKTAVTGVTVAASVQDWRIEF